MTFKTMAGCAKDFIELVSMTTSLGAQAVWWRLNPDIMCSDRKRRKCDVDRHRRGLMDSIRPNVIIISKPWLNANQTIMSWQILLFYHLDFVVHIPIAFYMSQELQRFLEKSLKYNITKLVDYRSLMLWYLSLSTNKIWDNWDSKQEHNSAFF